MDFLAELMHRACSLQMLTTKNAQKLGCAGITWSEAHLVCAKRIFESMILDRPQ